MSTEVKSKRKGFAKGLYSIGHFKKLISGSGITVITIKINHLFAIGIVITVMVNVFFALSTYGFFLPTNAATVFNFVSALAGLSLMFVFITTSGLLLWNGEAIKWILMNLFLLGLGVIVALGGVQ